MNAFEYAEAMGALLKIADPEERHRRWRAAKSARQRYLDQRRRERDPDWWQERLRRCKEYRRDQRHGRLSLCSGLPCESDSTVINEQSA